VSRDLLVALFGPDEVARCDSAELDLMLAALAALANSHPETRHRLRDAARDFPMELTDAGREVVAALHTLASDPAPGPP
jgi:hypothetical protein